MIVCKGYNCGKIAPKEMEEKIKNGKHISGWYCSDYCYYHPLSAG